VTTGIIPVAIATAVGLRKEDRQTVLNLCAVYSKTLARNRLRDGYYLMHIKPQQLGISVPDGLRNLEQAISWPAKAVDALADRSQFDGFTCTDEDTAKELQAIVRENALKRRYRKAVKGQLRNSCAFLTVTAGNVDAGEPAVIISAYSAVSAAALWDERLHRIQAGIVVVDRDNRPNHRNAPTWINVFTDTDIIRIRRALDSTRWVAEYIPHGMGRCLMEPLVYEATLDRPFGKSRITRAVMDLTDDAMRSSVRAEVAAEFMTAPQKYLVGADPDALNKLSKWDAYIGSIFAVSKDADGDTPTFGQLQQGSMQPHIDYMRSLAARFSAETNVPISELGIVSDNPSSAEAIYAAKEPLVVDAQNLNADNGEALRDIVLMALAVKRNISFAEVLSTEPSITAKWRNPAMPSIVSQADSMLKIAQAVPWIVNSEILLEELGFTDDQVQRLESDRERASAQELLRARFAAKATKTPADNQDLLDGVIDEGKQG
jgi:phage portal protein, SPP1 gp6-like